MFMNNIFSRFCSFRLEAFLYYYYYLTGKGTGVLLSGGLYQALGARTMFRIGAGFILVMGCIFVLVQEIYMKRIYTAPPMPGFKSEELKAEGEGSLLS